MEHFNHPLKASLMDHLRLEVWQLKRNSLGNIDHIRSNLQSLSQMAQMRSDPVARVATAEKALGFDPYVLVVVPVSQLCGG